MLGLRRGEAPRAIVTTTPRPVPLLRRILALDGLARSGGRTGDNLNVAAAARARLAALYEGTRLGRQELDGVLIEDIKGALWPRALLERSRGAAPPREDMLRVVVGIDPPASAAGVCGISVCGKGADGTLWVLADASEEGLSPEGWARAAARAYETWAGDRVVAEANQGGDMVASVLRGAAPQLPVKLVHASRRKDARAEPVSAAFERGEARFSGRFPDLEDQLAGMVAGAAYEGPGDSPDRADAMVWALTELMKPAPVVPRVRLL
jgi:phage terminase large subunit-like protein